MWGATARGFVKQSVFGARDSQSFKCPFTFAMNAQIVGYESKWERQDFEKLFASAQYAIWFLVGVRYEDVTGDSFGKVFCSRYDDAGEARGEDFVGFQPAKPPDCVQKYAH